MARVRGALFTLALLGLTVVVIGGSAFIGNHVPTNEGGFNWELAAVVGTALGTTFLALVTGYLGMQTSRDVQASRDVAELTREERRARERPIVILQRASMSVE